MALRISYCPYRLLFKHPFATAHGLRNGTDSLFLKVEENGAVGYGEITLPPYVEETVPDSIGRIQRIAALKPWKADELLEVLDKLEQLNDAPGCRAGLHMALIDWLGRTLKKSVSQVLNASPSRLPATLMTIGICSLEETSARLIELPDTGYLKLKVGDCAAQARVRWILDSTQARILLDGNQGLNSIAEAVVLAGDVGPTRLLGFEQPFAVGGEALGLELAERTGALVIGDESLQSEADLAKSGKYFGAVNIKLMKCGGLDRARRMIDEARVQGLKVMLGSMSESSLGCTAMAQLAGEADIIDLDGPWLVANDPFLGVRMVGRTMTVPDDSGLAVRPIGQLNWIDA